MEITFSNRVVAAFAVTVIAVGVQAGTARAGAARAGAGSRPAGSTVVQDATGAAARAGGVALRAADGQPAAKRTVSRTRQLVRKPAPTPAPAAWLHGDTGGTGLPWT